MVRLYKAILADLLASMFATLTKPLAVRAQKIRILDPEVDMSDVMVGVAYVLDESIIARHFVIPDSKEDLRAGRPEPDRLRSPKEAFRAAA